MIGDFPYSQTKWYRHSFTYCYHMVYLYYSVFCTSQYINRVIFYYSTNKQCKVVQLFWI